MVTEAGKELLRNTLNTAKFHNKILEENEMWKQWELEQGLTMMVSDDVILSRSKRHHQCSKHRNQSKSSSREREPIIYRGNNVAGSSKSDVDRWDHNGFRELYPDESVNEIYRSPALRDNEKKWDHSGFLELYPEEKHSASKSKDHSKKWDHSGFLELYPEEAQREKNLESKSKEYFKKHEKKKKHHSEEMSNSDSEIWEEFKVYKRKLAKKSKKYDSHIKEWKKHYKKEK